MQLLNQKEILQISAAGLFKDENLFCNDIAFGVVLGIGVQRIVGSNPIPAILLGILFTAGILVPNIDEYLGYK